MKHEKNIRKTLDSINTPEELENKLRNNWQSQLTIEQQKNRYRRPGLAIAASFVLLLFFSLTTQITPTLVDAAHKDILADAKFDIGVSVPLELLISQHDIQLPNKNMPVKTTKNCNINGFQTTHIQIQDHEEGEVHFFIKNGEFDTAFWQQQKGEIQGMPWKLIDTDKDLSVLVLYSSETTSARVDRLIQHMFFA